MNFDERLHFKCEINSSLLENLVLLIYDNTSFIIVLRPLYDNFIYCYDETVPTLFE